MSNNNEQNPVLQEFREKLQTEFPLLKKVKVKHFYSRKRFLLRASIGIRKIRVTGGKYNVFDKFLNEYSEKISTAF